MVNNANSKLMGAAIAGVLVGLLLVAGIVEWCVADDRIVPADSAGTGANSAPGIAEVEDRGPARQMAGDVAARPARQAGPIANEAMSIDGVLVEQGSGVGLTGHNITFAQTIGQTKSWSAAAVTDSEGGFRIEVPRSVVVGGQQCLAIAVAPDDVMSFYGSVSLAPGMRLVVARRMTLSGTIQFEGMSPQAAACILSTSTGDQAMFIGRSPIVASSGRFSTDCYDRFGVDALDIKIRALGFGDHTIRGVAMARLQAGEFHVLLRPSICLLLPPPSAEANDVDVLIASCEPSQGDPGALGAVLAKATSSSLKPSSVWLCPGSYFVVAVVRGAITRAKPLVIPDEPTQVICALDEPAWETRAVRLTYQDSERTGKRCRWQVVPRGVDDDLARRILVLASDAEHDLDVKLMKGMSYDVSVTDGAGSGSAVLDARDSRSVVEITRAEKCNLLVRVASGWSDGMWHSAVNDFLVLRADGAVIAGGSSADAFSVQAPMEEVRVFVKSQERFGRWTGVVSGAGAEIVVTTEPAHWFHFDVMRPDVSGDATVFHSALPRAVSEQWCRVRMDKAGHYRLFGADAEVGTAEVRLGGVVHQYPVSTVRPLLID